jgi:transposase
MAFLPAYSPELNPDEQVWSHAKSRLSKLPIASKEAIKKASPLYCGLSKGQNH